MTIKHASTTNTNGSRYGMMRSSEIRATVHAANRLTPKGGVIMPNAKLTTITSPKCTGSMPKCTATGARIGASTMMAALVSMNMPIKNSAALIPSKNIPGDFSTSCSQRPIASGTPARVIKNANRPALAIMNMITALDSTDFVKILDRSANLISR